MGILQLAIAASVPYQVLKHKVFSHPTLAEALNNLFLAWEPEPIELVLSQAAYSAAGINRPAASQPARTLEAPG